MRKEMSTGKESWVWMIMNRLRSLVNGGESLKENEYESGELKTVKDNKKKEWRWLV